MKPISNQKKAEIALIIALIILPFIPWLLTRSFGLYYFDNSTGAIGDTIGGITAPFCSLLGAFLVYRALIEQVNANDTFQQQFKAQEIKENQYNESTQINQLLSHLVESINQFRYTSLEESESAENQQVHFGGEGITKLFDDIRCHFHGNEEQLLESPYVSELVSILQISNAIIDRLARTTAPDKEIVSILLRHHLSYKALTGIKNLDKQALEGCYCESCRKNHGLPSIMIQEIMKIKPSLSFN
ncbi:MAG: hypothetical protein KA138_02235 [Saprospiraceae bacterium]|nr:hypothetical protein [Saprospiraceae bacterium]